MEAIARLEPCTLEGRLVRLEPMGSGHLEALCAAGLDSELWRLTVTRIATADDMRRYIDAALAEQREGTALPFVTVWRATGQVIGSTRFANAALPHRRVEIGWTWLARRWGSAALANRVLPMTCPVARQTVTKGSAVPSRCSASAASM